MTDSSRQNLVGYLLHALEHEEHERVADQLRCDGALRDDCQKLRMSLNLLAADAEPHVPPAELADRTCDSLWALVEVPPVGHSSEDYKQNNTAPASTAIESSFDSLSNAIDSAIESEHTVAVGANAPSLASSALTANSLSDNPAPRFRNWRTIDIVVAVGIMVVIGGIVLPSLQLDREIARRATCQNNLKDLGVAHHNYSAQHNGLLPVAAEKGNLAVAGAFAPMLRSAGYVKNASQVNCPSSLNCSNANSQIPTIEQIEAATGQDLVNLQNTMGGSYSCSVGYRENGVYKTLKNLQRKNFALMSDMRKDAGTGHHGAAGYNVLFEDGHCEYLLDTCDQCSHDNYFLNDDGQEAAGVQPNDAVMLKSGKKP